MHIEAQQRTDGHRVFRIAVVALFLIALLAVTIHVCPLCTGNAPGDIQKQSSKRRQVDVPLVLFFLPVLLVTIIALRPLAVVRPRRCPHFRPQFYSPAFFTRPPPLSL